MAQYRRDQIVGGVRRVEGLEAQAALDAGHPRRDLATALGERARIGGRLGRIGAGGSRRGIRA
jgi:hypothetical protein